MIQDQDRLWARIDETTISLVTLCCSGPSRVTRVEVPKDELLTALVGTLLNEIGVVAVRRSHERGCNAQYTLEGLLDEKHLVVDLVKRECGEVGVRPGVRGDHMSMLVSVLHTRDIVSVVDTAV